MQHNIYLYIMVSALVSFAVRAVPLTLIRKKIENPFLKSFLFYVPYVTLSVMTFPAIVETTAVPIAGVLALIAGIVAARKGVSMFLVAVICCVIVFAAEMLICEATTHGTCGFANGRPVNCNEFGPTTKPSQRRAFVT